MNWEEYLNNSLAVIEKLDSKEIMENISGSINLISNSISNNKLKTSLQRIINVSSISFQISYTGKQCKFLTRTV